MAARKHPVNVKFITVQLHVFSAEIYEPGSLTFGKIHQLGCLIDVSHARSKHM